MDSIGPWVGAIFGAGGTIAGVLSILDNIAKRRTESEERIAKAKIEADKEAAMHETAKKAAALETAVSLQGERLGRQALEISDCKDDRLKTTKELAECKEGHLRSDEERTKIKADIEVLKSLAGIARRNGDKS